MYIIGVCRAFLHIPIIVPLCAMLLPRKRLLAAFPGGNLQKELGMQALFS
jgi:hypothetical protein